MKKYIISLLVLAFVLGGGLYLYKSGLYSKLFGKQVKRELPEPTVPIKEYILGGKISAIRGNDITLHVGRVFEGSNGNFVDYEDKVVHVASTTSIIFRVIEDGKFQKINGTISDLKIGQQINLHSPQNIARMSSFTPTMVEVMPF